MKTIYRDGLEEVLDGEIKVYKTRDGHVVEEYQSAGEKRFFVTLAATPFCAHGNTLEEAIADAVWKDPAQRPSLEALKEEILAEGLDKRPISLMEFRTLTGACAEGCRVALKREKLSGAPMLAKDIYSYFPSWGAKLYDVLDQQLPHKDQVTR